MTGTARAIKARKEARRRVSKAQRRADLKEIRQQLEEKQ